MGNSKNIVIIGGGLAGLSTGYELVSRGFNPILFEKDSTVGGLSKTLWFDTSAGSFGFDFGGHRFLTRIKEIEQFFFDVVGKENIEVRQRYSHIYFKNKYFDYPIKPFSALLRMPIWLTIKAGFTYWYAFFRYFLARRRGEDNFEDWVKHRFGSTLYGLFFRDYTRKTWGISPKLISSIWASERIKADNFFQIIKNSLTKPDPESKIALTLYKQFYYPSEGIQVLSDKMADYIVNNGGIIHTGTAIKKLTLENNRIISLETSDGKKITGFSTVVSSIPLPELITSMNNVPEEVIEAVKNLKHRDLILVGFMIDKKEATNDSWIYFPEKDKIFVRISEPSKYGTKMCPQGKTSIAAEITCNRGDEKWEMTDDKLIETVKKQLTSLKFFTEEEIISSFVKRTIYAYPLFDVGYEKNLQIVMSFLLEIKNLELVGRAGTFQYINMDMVLLHGLNCAKKIAGLTDIPSYKLSHDSKWVG